MFPIFLSIQHILHMFHSIAKPILIYHIFSYILALRAQNHYNILSTNVSQNVEPIFPYLSSSPLQGYSSFTNWPYRRDLSLLYQLPIQPRMKVPIYSSLRNIRLTNPSENKQKLSLIFSYNQHKPCVTNRISYPPCYLCQDPHPHNLIPLFIFPRKLLLEYITH